MTTNQVSSSVLLQDLKKFVTSLLTFPVGWLHILGGICHVPTTITGAISLGFDSASAFISGLLDPLDLSWLHTLAGQVAGPAFTPPTCNFEALEGPHSEAVMRITGQQCIVLELASSRMMAANIHTVALDVATQVSFHCMYIGSNARAGTTSSGGFLVL